MKKILTIILMLSLWSTLCFANDIYVGNADGYASYLKAESVKASYAGNAGNPIATLTVIYTVVNIPEEQQLNYLKKLMLNDNISYMTSDFKFVNYHNRMENTIKNPAGALYLVENHLYDAKGVKTSSSGAKTSAKISELERANPGTAFNEVMEYIRSHQDTIPNI